MNPVLSDILTAIEAASSPEEMQALVEQIVCQFGFDGYSYHWYRPDDSSIDYIGEWPEEWLRRYENNQYVDIDPVVERLLRSTTPFRWSEAVANRPVNASERLVMNEARDFGIKEGAEIPIHDCGMGLASFSVFSSSFEDFQAAWVAHHTIEYDIEHAFPDAPCSISYSMVLYCNQPHHFDFGGSSVRT